MKLNQYLYNQTISAGMKVTSSIHPEWNRMLSNGW